MTEWIATCEGRKVATVMCERRRWQICWHSRQDARERIADLPAAKQWIAQLLYGKTVEWTKTRRK